jgi:hypothetical protein
MSARPRPPPKPKNRKPENRARAIARAAARKAAVTVGSLSLPPGPLGWLTILPELRALWQLQTQMVADIAGCYGKTADLNREEMLYCVFRHTDPQAVRDLVGQIGKRFVVQRLHSALRLPIKASIPSPASSVIMLQAITSEAYW